MSRIGETPTILRLQELLTGVRGSEDPRGAVRAVMAEDLQRIMIGERWSARTRLEMLADLARTAATGPLPVRERDAALAELGRLALRILWSEGLFGEALEPATPAKDAVLRLLELAASDLLPEGPAFRVVMERAKSLLRRHDVAAALVVDAALRERLLDLLVQAEDRVREIAA
ncbi:MAG: hypothetical protein JNM47_10340 [Hyphomonadaceae bacterium]|nr:hypothetical protein [Hyphomonadaceae bacterium]